MLRRIPLNTKFNIRSIALSCAKANSVEKEAVKKESERMKKFHKQLKMEKLARVPPGLRFVDLVLVDTDPSTGELVPEVEKEPTKWGDWQIGGRVTDF